jgi:hypothetical protein
MAILSKANNLITDIVDVLEDFDTNEKKEILNKLKIRRFLKLNNKPIANYDKSILKPPTMAQIDKWKHDSRKSK